MNDYEMTIQDLWYKIMNEGYEIRKLKCDGYVNWQPIKKRYSLIQTEYDVHKSFKKLMENIIFKIGEKQDLDDLKIIVDEFELDNEIEKDHFFVQLFRIPKLENYKLKVVKVLQIAYNIGQFKAELEKKSYDNKIINFFVKNNLDKFETYI